MKYDITKSDSHRFIYYRIPRRKTVRGHLSVIKAVDEFVELNNLQIDQIFCDSSFLIVNN